MLSGELQRERTINVTLAQKVELLVKEIEDATARAASPSFSQFSKEEFKELAIKINREHYCLVCELFKTLDNIFETHTVFDKMSVVLRLGGEEKTSF